jgi:transcription initiation factor TFIIE subunit alpha
LDPTQISNLIRNKRELVLKKLKERLDYEKNRVFYRCAGDDCPRYTFEEAMELSFQCAVCQAPLIHYNNQNIIEALEIKINYLSAKM